MPKSLLLEVCNFELCAVMIYGYNLKAVCNCFEKGSERFYFINKKLCEVTNFAERDNSTILDRTDKKKIITFKLDDILSLGRELTSLYYLLREEYSIIIAPLGPKPLTFISILMQ